MIKNADELKFRCSSLGFLMTYPEKKELPKGAITHAIDRFVSYRYGRHHDIFSRYITKGLMVEEDAITMYSRKHQQMFKKNEEIISNEFISGCPDFYEGESIKKADIITDIKSSWDIFTFFRTKVPDSLKMLYYWQLQHLHKHVISLF